MRIKYDKDWKLSEERGKKVFIEGYRLVFGLCNSEENVGYERTLRIRDRMLEEVLEEVLEMVGEYG